MKKATLSLVLAGLALLWLAPAALVSTLIVDNDRADCPNADFQSIELAVQAAAPGDTIQVCEGTYEEQVDRRQERSEDQGQGLKRAVVLEGPRPPSTSTASDSSARPAS